MSSIAHLYTDFGPLDGEEEDERSTDRVQDEKLAAFEEGYQAGWTDAEKNFAAEKNSVCAEFVQGLQDLAFTYHEALASLNRGLKPMFEQLTTSLLPRAIPATLRAHLVAELMQIAKSQSDAEVVLRVSDTDLMMVEDLLEGPDFHLPVRVELDSTLTPNQIMLDLDLQAREINLEKVTQGIVEALNAFNFHSKPEPTP